MNSSRRTPSGNGHLMNQLSSVSIIMQNATNATSRASCDVFVKEKRQRIDLGSLPHGKVVGDGLEGRSTAIINNSNHTKVISKVDGFVCCPTSVDRIASDAIVINHDPSCSSDIVAQPTPSSLLLSLSTIAASHEKQSLLVKSLGSLSSPSFSVPPLQNSWPPPPPPPPHAVAYRTSTVAALASSLPPPPHDNHPLYCWWPKQEAPSAGIAACFGRVSPPCPLIRSRDFGIQRDHAGSSYAPRVLVLDNDETTGYYPLASLLFSMYRILVHQNPPRDVLLNYLREGAARPGTKELLQTAWRLKAERRLDRLVIFTAASDKTGWVTFLVGLLEEYAEIPQGTIDYVATREHVKVFDSTSGQTLKDLRLICDDTRHLVMVDDKPEFVNFGPVIKVPPYERYRPIDALVEAIPCSKEGLATAKEALREDTMLHRPSPTDFANDRVLFEVAATLELLFPPFAMQATAAPVATTNSECFLGE